MPRVDLDLPLSVLDLAGAGHASQLLGRLGIVLLLISIEFGKIYLWKRPCQFFILLSLNLLIGHLGIRSVKGGQESHSPN